MATTKASIGTPLRIAGLMLSLLLCSCASQPEVPRQKVRHVRHQAPQAPLEVIEYSPDAYVLHLSLAKLELQSNPSDVSASAADFDIARAYSKQPQEASKLQPVIILEYDLKGQQKPKRVAIPFAMPYTESDFPGLDEAMSQLNSMPYTLYDLRPVVVNLSPVEPMGDEGSDVKGAEKMVDDRLQPLIKKASHLPPQLNPMPKSSILSSMAASALCG